MAVRSGSSALADALADRIATPEFRIYPGDDPRACELAGAAKNVIAIAAALALASAGEAWWYGLPIVAALLIPAAICALIAKRG